MGAQKTGKVMIHVSHLKKYFGKLEVLKDISLDVHEGEVVVIIGPSGSGKSTFLRCLNHLETATGGEIYVNGENILDRRTNINKVRENVGMVFQHFNLFPHMDVLKNLMMAPLELKKEDKVRLEQTAMRMLEKVGMQEKAHAIRSSFREASSSVWRSRVPSACIRTSCSSTNRLPPSTPRWWEKSLKS